LRLRVWRGEWIGAFVVVHFEAKKYILQVKKYQIQTGAGGFGKKISKDKKYEGSRRTCRRNMYEHSE